MKIQLKNIKPNPFRHMERYPLDPEKITTLQESYKATGFWDNVVARQCNGSAEIAYGHHRLEAARKLWGPNHEISLIIRDLDDTQMIKIMARENMEMWKTNALVAIETIRAVVQAFADGKIKLAKPKSMGKGGIKCRVAPSFVQVNKIKNEHAIFNAHTVAEFIGWLAPSGQPQEKVDMAIGALELIERGVLSEKDLEGLNVYQANLAVGEAGRTLRRREFFKDTTAVPVARHVAQQVAKDLRNRTPEHGTERDRARRITQKITQPDQRPMLHEFVEDLCEEIGKFLCGIKGDGSGKLDQQTTKLLEVLKVIDAVAKKDRDSLYSELRGLGNRCYELADMVKKGTVPQEKQLMRLLVHRTGDAFPNENDVINEKVVS